MQGKGVGVHPTVFDKAGFDVSPKTFDTVDVRPVPCELIFCMIDSKMLSVSNIDKAIVATPAIGVNDAGQTDLSPNNPLQTGPRAIWDYFSVHAAVAFEDAKYDGFAVGAPSPFSLYTTGPEEGFIYFNFSAKRRPGVTKLGQSHTYSFKVSVDGVATQAGQAGDLGGIEINRKQAH